MLNEFRRRLLDAVEFTDYLASFADPAREIVDIDTFSYVIDKDDTATTIVSTALTPFDVVMSSDSDFVCTGLSGYGRIQGDTMLTQNPAMLCQITDEASGRTFWDRPAPMAMIAGQGGFPFMLPSPWVIRPRSTVRVDATAARAGATFNGFYFVFHGGRIFYR